VFSVRLHGRGGQGIVTAAELLAAATPQRQIVEAVGADGERRTAHTV
jgi:Pyruvate/2-oxoacid:ferredoxin oxidoreductase gamma subunit